MNPRHAYFASAAASLVAVVGGIFSPAALVQAWHFAVLACLQPALGCLLLLLMFQCTGGRWEAPIRPALLAGQRMIVWCFLAVLPVLVFLPAVYRWAGAPGVVGDRSVFLNRTFFEIRILVYLIIYGGLAWLIEKGRSPSAGGLILFALIGYFLSIDLVMAIDPNWYSSGFPVVFMSSSAVMGLSLAIAIQAGSPSAQQGDPKIWRDLGNLLLAMVVFWSYVSFTQFLIIWMGNLPEEIKWYETRGSGAWRWVTAFLALCNLFGPFFILLSRAIKENPKRLRMVALVVLGSQVIYVYWLVAPSFPGRAACGFHWLDPVVLVAAGGLFAGRLLSSRKEAP